MTGRRSGRSPNGAGSFYPGADGRWHGRITVGIRDDGRPTVVTSPARPRRRSARRRVTSRRHAIPGTSPSPATAGRWRSGSRIGSRTSPLRPSGRRRWRATASRSTSTSSRPSAPIALIAWNRTPGEGVRQDAGVGWAPGTAHQAHRTIRTALNVAVRRGHLQKNPAALAKPPRVEDWEVDPLTLDEVGRVLDAAETPQQHPLGDRARAGTAPK